MANRDQISTHFYKLVCVYGYNYRGRETKKKEEKRKVQRSVETKKMIKRNEYRMVCVLFHVRKTTSKGEQPMSLF